MVDASEQGTDDQWEATQACVWHQHWLDVLFLHWQVRSEALRPHIPSCLEIDDCGGTWVSAVLFRLRVRTRWLPFLPGLSGLVEGNLRTYVRYQSRPGIWFLSVHGDNPWAIRLARLLTPMPYEHAVIAYLQSKGRFEYKAASHSVPSLLELQFRPGPTTPALAHDPLDVWLLERYRLFISGRRRSLLQAAVAHPRWSVQPVELSLHANQLGKRFGLDLSALPERAHYSPGVRARFGRFRPTGTSWPSPRPASTDESGFVLDQAQNASPQ
jgi:uncharacterized protein YqjF (DUF2071 family)